MFYIIALFMLLLSFPQVLAAQVLAADEAASKYQDLLAIAKSGQRPVDWQALRFAYASSPEFDLLGLKSQKTREAMNEAMRTNDYAGALAQANLILDQNYVDIDAHIIGEIANSKLGNSEEAKKHHEITIGLLRSIHSGDGKTPESAFTVITIGEEYSLIRVMGLRRNSQALITKGGHSYDVLEVVDREGKSQSLYFQVDLVMAAEAALLKGKH